MKPETGKSILDEIGFVLTAILTFIVLAVIIFPLFILALPIVLISGCKEIWYLDHIKNNVKA
jgi:hypothetical protein